MNWHVVLQPATEELQTLARRAATCVEMCYHEHAAREHGSHNAGTSNLFCWNHQSFLLEPAFLPQLQQGLTSNMLRPVIQFAGTQ